MPMRPAYVSLPHATIKDSRPAASVRGYDHAWSGLRHSFLSAHPCCTFCNHPATVCDHIKPLAVGGARLNESNLRSVCVDCHAKLTMNFRRFGVNEMVVPVATRMATQGRGVV